MNLKKELDDILEKYGRDVLVIRQDKKKRCVCYDEVNKEARRDCPFCLGLGYVYTAEKHRTRAMDTNVSETLSRLIKGTSIGGTRSSARKYYFKSEMSADIQDLVVEVDWDEFNRPTYNGKGIWGINSIDYNMHLNNESNVFKVVHVSEQIVRSRIRGINITEANGIREYQIAVEG